MKQITVLLVDDHQVVREGFRRVLELESDIQVVGEASDGREGAAMARTLRPDVVLMDIAMPQLNGIEGTRRVVKWSPGTRVLILSAHHDDAYLQGALDAGAVGFLPKQAFAHEVCRGIREVSRGNAFFDGSRRAGGRHLFDSQRCDLTSRELEVLQLIAEGRPNKGTAAELGISVKTVEKHREHIMRKLKIHDIAGLTRYAIASGITENRV